MEAGGEKGGGARGRMHLESIPERGEGKERASTPIPFSLPPPPKKAKNACKCHTYVNNLYDEEGGGGWEGRRRKMCFDFSCVLLPRKTSAFFLGVILLVFYLSTCFFSDSVSAALFLLLCRFAVLPLYFE